ncbi:MAG: hypothetical protein ACKVS9_17965 [Phycisphaerae bacterium]
MPSPKKAAGARILSDCNGVGWTYDANLAELRRRVAGPVRYYVIASIDASSDRFVQNGSAPNFAGGFITLCTCKHRMRTAHSAEDWVGQWVAGFTRKALGHQLVYLMRIGWAFDSHRDLGGSRVLPARTKHLKSAHINTNGDVFEYREGSPHSPASYEPPHPAHSHANPASWHRDVGYRGRKRPAALLVGDPTATFIWTRPMITISEPPYRGHRGPLGAKAFLAKLCVDSVKLGRRVSRTKPSCGVSCVPKRGPC